MILTPEGDRSEHSSLAGFRSDRHSPDHFLFKLDIVTHCTQELERSGERILSLCLSLCGCAVLPNGRAATQHSLRTALIVAQVFSAVGVGAAYTVLCKVVVDVLSGPFPQYVLESSPMLTV